MGYVRSLSLPNVELELEPGHADAPWRVGPSSLSDFRCAWALLAASAVAREPACTYVHVYLSYCLHTTLSKRSESRCSLCNKTLLGLWVPALPPPGVLPPCSVLSLTLSALALRPRSLTHTLCPSSPTPVPDIPLHPPTPSHHSRDFWAQNLAGKKRSPSTNEARVIQRDILTETTVTTTRGPLTSPPPPAHRPASSGLD